MSHYWSHLWPHRRRRRRWKSIMQQSKTKVVNPLHRPVRVLVSNVAGNTGRSFLYHAIRDPTRRFSRIIGCILPSQRNELNELRKEFRQWSDQVEIRVADPLREKEYVREEQPAPVGDEEECQPLSAVMKGVDYIYLVPIMEPERVDHIQRYIEAAVEGITSLLFNI